MGAGGCFVRIEVFIIAPFVFFLAMPDSGFRASQGGFRMGQNLGKKIAAGLRLNFSYNLCFYCF